METIKIKVGGKTEEIQSKKRMENRVYRALTEHMVQNHPGEVLEEIVSLPGDRDMWEYSYPRVLGLSGKKFVVFADGGYETQEA